jgi:uncharacterized iron-regulated protein
MINPSENVAPQENHNSAPNPWLNNETLSEEIANQGKPVNYVELVGDNSVIMLGEKHGNTSIREHIARNAAEFKKAGITHWAIEAPYDPAFDDLNNGNPVDLSSVDLGPLSHIDKSYEQAVRAMASQGIKVVPVDMDQRTIPSSEEREPFLKDSVKLILADDPDAKVAVLMGSNHTDKNKSPHTVTSMTARLVDEGIKVVAVHYVGGTESSPSHFLGATAKANLGQSEFMMDLRPYQEQEGVVFGAGSADYVIHLPQQASTPDRLSSFLGGATLSGGY